MLLSVSAALSMGTFFRQKRIPEFAIAKERKKQSLIDVWQKDSATDYLFRCANIHSSVNYDPSGFSNSINRPLLINPFRCNGKHFKAFQTSA
jgi:hypothetical protein